MSAGSAGGKRCEPVSVEEGDSRMALSMFKRRNPFIKPTAGSLFMPAGSGDHKSGGMLAFPRSCGYGNGRRCRRRNSLLLKHWNGARHKLKSDISEKPTVDVVRPFTGGGASEAMKIPFRASGVARRYPALFAPAQASGFAGSFDCWWTTAQKGIRAPASGLCGEAMPSLRLSLPWSGWERDFSAASRASCSRKGRQGQQGGNRKIGVGQPEAAVCRILRIFQRQDL